MSYYDFVCYRSTYHSFQAEADIDVLCEIGWLNIKKQTLKLMTKPKALLKKTTLSGITEFIQFDAKTQGELITKNETDYPTLSHKQPGKVVFTIGYEGLSFEAYANQLIRHEVEIMIKCCSDSSSILPRKNTEKHGKSHEVCVIPWLLIIPGV